MPDDKPSLALVHLARGANGAGPWQRFLQSYDAYPAGIANHLYVIAKHVEDPGLLALLRRDATDRGGTVLIRTSDDGFDLEPYRWCAALIHEDYVCFLNSFSTINAPDWLALLTRPLFEDSSLAMTGCSGSWESMTTNQLLSLSRTGNLLRRAKRAANYLVLRRHFPVFPNPHIRTNAFVLKRTQFLELEWPKKMHKQTAHALESGFHSISRQVRARWGEIALVDRNGTAYRPDLWYPNALFRGNRCADLLVQDNRTREYMLATPEERHRLESYAWGAP